MTSMSGSTFRDDDSPMRTMKWSSTTRIRIGFEFCIVRLRRTRNLPISRNYDRQPSSASRLALNSQLAAHGLGTLAHVEQPKMAARRILTRDEARAVIRHCQANRSRRIRQLNVYPPRASMGYGIRNSLLS